METPSVPTAVTSFTWTALFTLIIALINGAGLAQWIKRRPDMRKLEVDAEQRLRDDLMGEIGRLRIEHTEQVSKLEQRLEAQRMQYEGTISLLRHRCSNLDFCLDLLLALIRADAGKAQEAAEIVSAKRAEQKAIEAQESAAINSAKINAAGSPNA